MLCYSVPAGPPIIHDENGRVLKGTIPPVAENSIRVLICKSSGGVPPPTLSWWINGKEYDHVSIIF